MLRDNPYGQYIVALVALKGGNTPKTSSVSGKSNSDFVPLRSRDLAVPVALRNL